MNFCTERVQGKVNLFALILRFFSDQRFLLCILYYVSLFCSPTRRHRWSKFSRTRRPMDPPSSSASHMRESRTTVSIPMMLFPTPNLLYCSFTLWFMLIYLLHCPCAWKDSRLGSLKIPRIGFVSQFCKISRRWKFIDHTATPNQMIFQLNQKTVD